MEILNKITYKGEVKAVVFDWAGTTVDFGSMAPVKAFVETFAERNVEVTIDEVRAPMGRHKKDHIREVALNKRVGKVWLENNKRPWDEDDIQQMFENFVPSLKKIIHNHCTIIPGILEAQKDIKERKIFLGSNTGYNTELMEIVAPLAAEQGYRPDSLVCASEVLAGRPSPLMVYLTALRNNIWPMEAFVKVGDTVADIGEGINAGCWSVGVVDSSNEIGLTEQEFAALNEDVKEEKRAIVKQKYIDAGAHFVINTLHELPQLLDKVNDYLKQGERP